jgi:hypothetical protein
MPVEVRLKVDNVADLARLLRKYPQRKDRFSASPQPLQSATVVRAVAPLLILMETS